MRKLTQVVWLSSAVVLTGAALRLEGQPEYENLISDPDAVPAVHEICRHPPLLIPVVLERVAAAMARCSGRQAEIPEQAACKALRGLELSGQGANEAGQESLREALRLYERSDDLLGQSVTHLMMGGSLRLMDNGPTAESYFRQALGALLDLHQRAAPVPDRSVLLFAQIFRSEDETRQIELLPQAGAKDMMWVEKTLMNYYIGVAVACQARFEEAETPLRRSLANVRSKPDLFLGDMLYSLIHEHLGWIYLKLWRVEDAVRSYRSALKMAHLRSSIEFEYLVNYRLSQLYGSTGQLEAALDANQKAIEAVKSVPLAQAELQVERAVFLARGGRLGESRKAVEEARTLSAKSEGPLDQANILFSAGKRLSRLGFPEDAASFLSQAAGILREEEKGGDERSIQLLASTSLSLIMAYDQLGLRRQRQIEIDKLKLLAIKHGHDSVLIRIEFLEASWSAMGPGATAVDEENYLKALRRFREDAKNWDHQTPEEKKDFDKAMGFVERVVRIEDPAEFSEAILQMDEDAAIIANPFGKAMKQFKKGNDKKGWRELEKMYEAILANTRPPRLDEVQIRMGMAFAATMQGKLELGVARAREAMELFEVFIEEMRTDEAMNALLDKVFLDEHGVVGNFYQLAVEIFARIDVKEAFSYAEKGRAWTLRRLLGSERRMDPETERRENEVLQDISTLERDLVTAAPADVAHLHQELAKRREAFETLRLERKLTTAGEMPMARVAAVDADRLRREVLDGESTLLTYFQSPGHLRIWVIDRGQVEMTAVPLSDEAWAEMSCRIEALRWQGSPPQARKTAARRGATLLSPCAAGDDPAGDLYQQLIRPVASLLRKPRLIIVPYGALHHLPFAALRRPETGRYLIQDFTLSLAPSASSLELLSKRRGAGSGEPLILGDPITHLEPLAGARQEAKNVGRLVGFKPHLGALATESRIHQSAGRVRLLHLAAHGEYLPANPRFSRLYLTPDDEHDGTLEMHEVQERLDLRGTELVVLSGCQTGLGEVSPSDMIDGLPTAFLVAGSRAVISTLWPVDDEASARLMGSFYERYLRGDVSVSEALQVAQLEMLGEDASVAPYYWAGFTLTGDPNSRWQPSSGAPAVAIQPPVPVTAQPPAPVSVSATPPVSTPGPRSVKRSGPAPAKVRPEIPTAAGDARTLEERKGSLDKKFEEVLADFDALLLRDKEALERERTARSSASMAGGGAGSGGVRGGGEGDVSTGSAGPAGHEGHRSPSVDDVPGEGRDSRVPIELRDSTGDDIVARQLREAAINEDDPELRERLWDEYRRYKTASRKSDEDS